MKAKVKVDRLTSKQVIKAIEDEYKRAPHKLMNQKDAEVVRKIVIRNAKSGNTGFIFNKTYSEKYKKLKNKKGVRSKFYSPNTGAHTLDLVKAIKTDRGVAGRITIFLPNAFARQKEYWHRMGLAGNSSKVRQWFGINEDTKNRIIKTIIKRLDKLNKKR